MKFAKTVGAVTAASILFITPMAAAQETTQSETKTPIQQSQTKAPAEKADKSKGAQDPQKDTPVDSKEALEKSNLSPEEKASFEALDKFVDQKEKTLDYKGAKADAKIDDNVLKDYAAGLQASGWKVESVGSDAQAIQESADQLAPTAEKLEASCKGKNGFQKAPPAILLNSCAASELQQAYQAGANGAKLAALITSETGAGAAIAGAVGTALTIGSGVVGMCNAWDSGIKIYPGGICWAQ